MYEWVNAGKYGNEGSIEGVVLDTWRQGCGAGGGGNTAHRRRTTGLTDDHGKTRNAPQPIHPPPALRPSGTHSRRPQCRRPLLRHPARAAVQRQVAQTLARAQLCQRPSQRVIAAALVEGDADAPVGASPTEVPLLISSRSTWPCAHNMIRRRIGPKSHSGSECVRYRVFGPKLQTRQTSGCELPAR